MRIKFEAHFVFDRKNAFRFSQPSRFVFRDLNITLGYSFNKLFGVLGGRIYGTVQNPFVITKYKGLDPEVANAADKTFGIDKNVYPRPLVGILGVSLNF